jgi:hypothetical protein
MKRIIVLVLALVLMGSVAWSGATPGHREATISKRTSIELGAATDMSAKIPSMPLVSSTGVLTWDFYSNPQTKTEKPIVPEKRSISIQDKEKYLEVTVYPHKADPIVYRIWPCGKIERMEWKEIAGNKETTAGRLSGVLYGSDAFVTYPGTTVLTLPDNHTIIK